MRRTWDVFTTPHRIGHVWWESGGSRYDFEFTGSLAGATIIVAILVYRRVTA